MFYLNDLTITIIFVVITYFFLIVFIYVNYNKKKFFCLKHQKDNIFILYLYLKESTHLELYLQVWKWIVLLIHGEVKFWHFFSKLWILFTTWRSSGPACSGLRVRDGPPRTSNPQFWSHHQIYEKLACFAKARYILLLIKWLYFFRQTFIS